MARLGVQRHLSAPYCCEKRHKDGTTTPSHQSPGAVLVHPQRREVLPVVAPEAIVKSDGRKKNACPRPRPGDCERNAAKCLLTELRREHPRGSGNPGVWFRLRWLGGYRPSFPNPSSTTTSSSVGPSRRVDSAMAGPMSSGSVIRIAGTPIARARPVKSIGGSLNSMPV